MRSGQARHTGRQERFAAVRRPGRLAHATCLSVVCLLVVSLAALIVGRTAGAAPAPGSAPSFSWATSPISIASPTLDGSSNGDLLASFGQIVNADGSAGPPLASLWDTASGLRTGATASDYASAGETVATADGSHVFFSAPASSSGRCEPFLASRDGTTTHVFPDGPLYQAGPACTMIPTGDGNDVLIEVDTTDPSLAAATGWYLVDEQGDTRRITDLDRSGPFGGTPCAPTVSPNGVDAIVSDGGVCGSVPDTDLEIVHLDGRPATPVVAPAGYHLTGLPLASYLDSTPRKPQDNQLRGQWTPDGSQFAVPVTQDATCSDVTQPTCIMRLAILPIDGTLRLVGPADQRVLTNWFSSGTSASSSVQSAPLMSNDGTHVAYLTSGASGLSLWVSAIDGSYDQRVSVDLSDVAEVKRAGDGFAVLTYSSIHLGATFYWVAADGTSARTVQSNGTDYVLWSIEAASADTAYIYGWDNLGPANANRSDTIYAINLGGSAMPIRLIPYSEAVGEAWVTGVSADGSRVSGWAPAADGRTYRGWTVTLSTQPPPVSGTYSLALAPSDSTDTAGGTHAVTAQLFDGATPVVGAQLTFIIYDGPNAGAVGKCSITRCTTDTGGEVNWVYRSNGRLGVDRIRAFYDQNNNGLVDMNESQATATEAWIPPTIDASSRGSHWAGYILKKASLGAASAQIVVPSLPEGGCVGPVYPSSTMWSSFWIGFNGTDPSNVKYLPQIGFNANCNASNMRSKCNAGTSGGPDYYLWWQTDPSMTSTAVCSLSIAPGDKVDLFVLPLLQNKTVYMSASLLHADGTTRDTWSASFDAKKVRYDSMECVAEAPYLPGNPAPVAPLANFGTTLFNGCSAVEDYVPGATLIRQDMQRKQKNSPLMASTGRISLDPNGFSHFTVAWHHS
jgi:hypothetical protein